MKFYRLSLVVLTLALALFLSAAFSAPAGRAGKSAAGSAYCLGLG